MGLLDIWVEGSMQGNGLTGRAGGRNQLRNGRKTSPVTVGANSSAPTTDAGMSFP